VVEDAPSGIAAGRAAGASVIAVTTTHPAPELSDANAVTEILGSLQARLDTNPGGFALELVIDREYMLRRAVAGKRHPSYRPKD